MIAVSIDTPRRHHYVRRVLTGVLIVLMAVTSPWYVGLCFGTLAIAMGWYEAVLLGVLLDVQYAGSFAHLPGGDFLFTALGCTACGITMAVRHYVRPVQPRV